MRRVIAVTIAAASVVTLAAGLAARLGSRPPSAVTPASRDEAWLGRHEEFVRQGRAGRFDVVFFGDSITAHWRDTGRDVWARHFEPLRAVNFGIGSDGTQNVRWRIQNGELPAAGVEVVVVLVGTVNLNHPDARAEDVAAGIAGVVQDVRERSPHTRVLVIGVLPRGERPNPARTRVEAVNAIIATLADGRAVRYVDIAPRLLTADGTLSRAVSPDEVHLSARGYEIVADAITEPIRQMLVDARSTSLTTRSPIGGRRP